MGKKPSPAYEFIVAQLRDDPELSFHDVRDLGEVAGLLILPVVYGRAKALMGLVPVTPYGQKKAKRKSSGQASRNTAGDADGRLAAQPEERGVGSSAGPRQLDDFIHQIHELKRQRDAAVDLLTQIKEMLETVLAEKGEAES